MASNKKSVFTKIMEKIGVIILSALVVIIIILIIKSLAG